MTVNISIDDTLTPLLIKLWLLQQYNQKHKEYQNCNFRGLWGEWEEKKKVIMDVISREAQLRSKRELIEKFIAENLSHISDSSDVANSFESFITKEKLEAFNKLLERKPIIDRLSKKIMKFVEIFVEWL